MLGVGGAARHRCGAGLCDARFAALALVTMAAGPWSVAAAAIEYTIGVDAGLERLSAEVCFDGDAPIALVAADARARRYLLGAQWSDGQAITQRRGRLELGSRRDDCLDYEVDLARAGRDSEHKAGRDIVVVSPGVWLWRPVNAPGAATLRFELPRDNTVSVPWPASSEDQGTYTLTDTPEAWAARTAFGRFPSVVIAVPGARLRLAIALEDAAVHVEKITRWVEANAVAITTLYGRFPVESPQVLVSARRASGPVPWGQVLRGGQPAVMLSVDTRHDLDAFLDDWTLSHEFSHLFFPYVSRRQAWLSEGFASYYQNVLRARAGLLTPQQAWQNLHDGFGRGIADTRGRPLSETTRRMRSDRAFMRVYWSGVAIALLADVEIRRTTAGRASLDIALGDLRICCVPGSRAWTAEELAAKIDAFTNTDVLGKLVSEYEHARDFPPVRDLYPLLGIEVHDGMVRLDDGAPLAKFRRDIVTASH